MNTNNLTIRNKIIMSLLFIVSAALLYLLIYALVYASPDSNYKKYAIIIGLAFIIAGRITMGTYKNFTKNKNDLLKHS
jgi:hypothetical protein